MSPQEILWLKKELAVAWAYYGDQPDPLIMAIYAKHLSDLQYVEVSRAIQGLMADPKRKKGPLPAEIRAFIDPNQSVDELANETAAKIIGAIRRYGWTNAFGARKFIGEEGWRIVERQGGWQSICESMKDNMVPTSQAQMREQLKSEYRQRPTPELPSIKKLIDQ